METIQSKCRIIFANTLEHYDYKVFQDDFKSQTLLIGKGHKETSFESIDLDSRDLNQVLNELFLRGIRSLYIEGGMQLISSFLTQKPL